MGKPYLSEIENIPKIANWAKSINAGPIAKLLERWADAPLIFVGSGGSYTAAKSLASFHERKYGQPGIALTPLLLERALKSLHGVRLVLLSAEGRNKDIISAAECARAMDVPCAAITLSRSSPLVDYAKRWGSMFVFSYEVPWGKDGYLATNSLISTIIVGLLAYFGDQYQRGVEVIINKEEIEKKKKKIQQEVVLKDVKTRGMIVLYGPETEIFAVDLESKISEAALGMCQVADYRQFAHGRHLQYAASPSRSPILLSAFSSQEKELACKTVSHLPDDEFIVKLEIDGEESPLVHVSSVVSSILLTAIVAEHVGIDPGAPHVPSFGRDLYALDVGRVAERIKIPSIQEIGAIRKSKVVAPSLQDRKMFGDKAKEYLAMMAKSVVKAIVFDYDGTLCNVHDRYDPLDPKAANIIMSSIESGVVVGVATGRGNSVIKELQSAIPGSYWKHIFVGLHSGSQVNKLNEEYELRQPNPYQESALEYLRCSCIGEFISEKQIFRREGQLGIRLPNKELSGTAICLLNEWINSEKKDGWRAFYSGHSIDILDENTSKNNVVKHISKEVGIDPLREILRIGDAGQESGNDWELLSEGIALSVEGVSRASTSCWNFAPSGVRQLNATIFYVENLTKVPGGLLVNFAKDDFQLEEFGGGQ